MPFAFSETPEHVRSTLGAILRRRRELGELRLVDVAASARVSPGFLSEVERGRKEISVERLLDVCRSLEIPLADVYLELSHELGAPIQPRLNLELDPRQQLRHATAVLSGEALRAAAQFSAYLAATNPPAKRPIGFLR
jgi:transcriptional regulator with XRE-family HTH domain